ncbi:HNH endonuclease [Enterococcus innesii]|uniref:HNH endonuclease n=1 Tax=Enterococcus innesii TaxID=2839759 RepID=UPI003B5B46AA
MKNIIMNGQPNPSYLIDREGNVFNAEGHAMTLFTTENGYVRVKLSRDCKRGMYLVHRLVAATYLPNPNNYPVVNHKDAVRDNNSVENLEWCTHSYNNKYTILIHGNPTHCNKPVKQHDHATKGIIAEFPSMTIAQQETGVQKANIYKVCTGKRKTAGGFYWSYAA